MTMPTGSRLLLPGGLWSREPSWCSGVRSFGLGRATSDRAGGSLEWPAKFPGSKGGPEGSQPRLDGYKTPRTKHEEGARIHRREDTGGQAQERAGVALKPRSLQVPGMASAAADSILDPKPPFVLSAKGKFLFSLLGRCGRAQFVL
jgi:hypothetical protein